MRDSIDKYLFSGANLESKFTCKNFNLFSIENSIEPQSKFLKRTAELKLII